MSVRIVRLGTPRTHGEGLRIGTVRRPPRGVPKSDFAKQDWYDVWFPNLAPSVGTMKLGHAAVIAALTRCRVIVRYGIGYDNVDLAAAKARSIPVCNVPDYGVSEVAEHAVSLALALARQLPQIDAHSMMADFGCTRIACDPFVGADAMKAEGVEKVEADELFARADILSLHLPLTAETLHFVSAARLAAMKKTAILVNTARGPLIDTVALAQALQEGTFAGAGIDVFESEPLSADHPLRTAPRALLTSHVAWYSESSIPRLQRLAVEEVVRDLRGEPLRNQVNR